MCKNGGKEGISYSSSTRGSDTRFEAASAGIGVVRKGPRGVSPGRQLSDGCFGVGPKSRSISVGLLYLMSALNPKLHKCRLQSVANTDETYVTFKTSFHLSTLFLSSTQSGRCVGRGGWVNVFHLDEKKVIQMKRKKEVVKEKKRRRRKEEKIEGRVVTVQEGIRSHRCKQRE